jgi:hypothetical protein
MKELNHQNTIQVIKVEWLTEQHLVILFKGWSEGFDIDDGIILELNSIREKCLGS